MARPNRFGRRAKNSLFPWLFRQREKFCWARETKAPSSNWTARTSIRLSRKQLPRRSQASSPEPAARFLWPRQTPEKYLRWDQDLNPTEVLSPTHSTPRFSRIGAGSPGGATTERPLEKSPSTFARETLRVPRKTGAHG